MIKKYFISIISVTLIVTGFILIIVFSFNSSFNDGSGNLNPDLASKYGSLVGGLVGALFSLAGILLIFESLITQKRTFDKQQFESKYFELIRYHRENVSQIEVTMKNNDKPLSGYKALVHFKNNIEHILTSVKEYTQKEQFCDEDILKHQIKIAYVFFFYGFEENSLDSSIKMLSNTYKPDYNNLSYWKQIFDYSKDDIINSDKYNTNGHQELLGHYFRHLYNSFMFIKNTPTLNNIEKYEYGKILRSQLSTYEQAILFYNALSPFGQPWISNNLITEFQLIKNIPPHFLTDINPKQYFGKIIFEWEKNTT